MKTYENTFVLNLSDSLSIRHQAEIVPGGDLSADDSSSASTATNQPAPVRRRASISRKEADHVEESIAKQQQDAGAREVLEDVYLNVFELPGCCLLWQLLNSHTLVVLCFWCVGLLRLQSIVFNPQIYKRDTCDLENLCFQDNKAAAQEVEEKCLCWIIKIWGPLKIYQHLRSCKSSSHRVIIQNAGLQQAMQNDRELTHFANGLSVNHKFFPHLIYKKLLQQTTGKVAKCIEKRFSQA